jgi:hypothetical protein
LEEALKDAGAYSNDCMQKFSMDSEANKARVKRMNDMKYKCVHVQEAHMPNHILSVLADDRGSVNRRQFCPNIPRLFVADSDQRACSIEPT